MAADSQCVRCNFVFGGNVHHRQIKELGYIIFPDFVLKNESINIIGDLHSISMPMLSSWTSSVPPRSPSSIWSLKFSTSVYRVYTTTAKCPMNFIFASFLFYYSSITYSSIPFVCVSASVMKVDKRHCIQNISCLSYELDIKIKFIMVTNRSRSHVNNFARDSFTGA